MKVATRHRWLAAQAVVSLVLVGLLARRLDLDAFRTLLLRVPAWFYLLSLALILGGQVLYAWRWRLLLSAAGVDTSFGAVLRQYFIGIFVNNFLPSTVGGDLAKVYYLGRHHGYRPVTASVVLDRMLGIGILSVLAAAAMTWTPANAPALVAARVAVTAIAAGCVLMLVLAAAGTGGLPARVGRLGDRAVSLAERLQRLRFDMAAALNDPAILAKATVVVAGYFVAVTAIYIVFIRLQQQASPGFAAVFAVVTATSVLSNIPVSLNGLGLREQLHAALLAPFGVSREAAVAISLLLFGHLLVASVIGLVFWLQAPAVPPDLAVQIET